MNMIVSADRNWAIGNKGSLLVSIPSDMKYFREETLGKVLVMGRKTLESLPGGLPLPGRTSIVLSTRESYGVKGAVICRSLEELREELKKYPSEDIYVIGGGKVYEELLPECDIVHVTRVDKAYEADTWFPNLDESDEWEITADSEERTYFDLEYRFLRYERVRT